MTEPLNGGGGAPRGTRAASTALVTRLSTIDTTIAARFGLDDPELLPDLGVSGRDAVTEAYRDAASSAEAIFASDGVSDAETVLLRFHASAEWALREHGDTELQLAAPFSPIGSLRALFPERVESDEPQRDMLVTARLSQVPATLAAYRARLADAITQGHIAGPAQTVAAAHSWRSSVRGGLFRRAAPAGAAPELVADAERALLSLADWLENSYLPDAAIDAVGVERYERAWLRRTASSLPLREAYDWAQDRVAELTGDRQTLLTRWGINSGSELREQLDRGERADLGNRLLSRQDLLAHLDEIHRESLDYTAARIAHVPTALPHLESAVGRPGGSESAHYQRATRHTPARTVLPHATSGQWPTWALRSLWHHEGAPGHHLQLGGWLLDTDRNGLYRSTIGTIEAVTEGWAMYAETLMRRHGRLDELDTFGYLDGQILRAARVIVDIGLHAGDDLDLSVPGGDFDGARWTPETAAGYLAQLRPGSRAAAEREVVRYLSWPAQAASYALGEREWWAARARAEARGGFEEREWHTHVLAAGSLVFAGIDAAGIAA